MSVKNSLPIRRPPKTFSLDREDTMDDTITTTYYLCEEFLKATGHRDETERLVRQERCPPRLRQIGQI
jgi:hypothetical protein